MGSPISQGFGRVVVSARPGLKPTSCLLAARPPQRPADVAVPRAVEVVVPLRRERAVREAARPLNPEHFRLNPLCSHGRQKNRGA